jgi:hypothetical protein
MRLSSSSCMMPSKKAIINCNCPDSKDTLDVEAVGVRFDAANLTCASEAGRWSDASS